MQGTLLFDMITLARTIWFVRDGTFYDSFLQGRNKVNLAGIAREDLSCCYSSQRSREESTDVDSEEKLLLFSTKCVLGFIMHMLRFLFLLDIDFFYVTIIRMTKTSLITLQEGEEIYWQGKAHYPRPGIIEYIPAFVAALLLSNAYQQLCEAEPFIILHQFCSDSFVGGILLLFLLGGLAFPTMKRKLAARQTYIFTNQRAISLYTATGGILQTIPAEKLGNKTPSEEALSS